MGTVNMLSEFPTMILKDEDTKCHYKLFCHDCDRYLSFDEAIEHNIKTNDHKREFFTIIPAVKP